MRKSDSQKFIHLIYKTAAKWTNWDPPKPIKVGDYGTIDEYTGEFNWEGSIYNWGLLDPDDPALAPHVQERGDERLTITSESVRVQEISAEPKVNLAAVVDAGFKVDFQFEATARGAVLIMHKPRYTSLPNDERIIKLLQSRPDPLKGKYVVTEVISCPAYLMHLSVQAQEAFTVSFIAQVPTSIPGISAGGQGGFKWLSKSATGLCRHGGESGATYVPLYKLQRPPRKFWDVFRGSTPTPGGLDSWEDVEPPWDLEDDTTTTSPPPFAGPSSHPGVGDEVGEDLWLHIEMDEELTLLRQDIAAENGVKLVEKEQADIGIALENEKIVFNILDPATRRWGFTRMPFTLDKDSQTVLPIIRAATHYYRHLRQRNPKSDFQQQIEVKFTRALESDDFDDDFLPKYESVGPNLVRNNNVIELEIGKDSDTMVYGVKIRNNGDTPLYPALFYFDHSDLSIDAYYQSPPNQNTAPLPARDTLAIGYGGNETYARPYFLRDGQDVDIGFLKLFLSKEHVDWSHVPQKSPFQGPDNRATLDGTRPVSQIDTLRESICIPMIQRRVP